MSDKEDLVSYEDTASIGFRMVDAADRLLTMDAIVPGAEAKWSFHLDDELFEVRIMRGKSG